MKKEAFSFSMVPNVPANAEFHFFYDDKIICKRIGKTEKVRYNYGEHSLSSAAQAAYEKVYSEKDSRNLAGPAYWLYEGKSLNKWRIENEQKKIDKIVDEHTSSLISTEKVVNFIENYPVSSLKNWGDKFYGYPEEILKKMWDMAEGSEEEKLKKKICVLDDFGLQVHRFLIKKGISPENIYFCISKDDESFLKIVKAVYSKLANNEKICSIFSLTNVFGDNNMFDLIIANPPYGQNATLAKDIITAILNSSPKQTVLLMPLSGFKFFKKYDWLKEVTFIKENPFADTSFTSDLTISIFEKGSNKIKDYEGLNKMNHPETFKWIGANAKYPNPVEHWEYKTFSSSHMTLEETKEYSKKFDRERLFIQTSRNAYDNVHSRKGGAFDVEFNLNEGGLTVSDQYLILFKSKIERDNFCKWYYETAWNDKNALIRRLLKMISQTCGVGLIEMIPHVDWSRPWTDTEILKELGLPEDFLGVKTNDE